MAYTALAVVILIGAGCGWLYFSGRTYWFDPDFIKTRVSYYLSTGTPDATPQNNEVVDQPAPQAPPVPVTKPDAAPAPAKTQPSTNGSGAAAGATAAPTPVSHPHAMDSHPARAANATALSQGPVKSPSAHQKAVSESIEVQDAIARGQYYFNRGDYDAAIQVYEKSLELFPSNQRLAEEITRAKHAKAAEAKYLR